MANKRTDMRQIRQIYRLYTQGVSKLQISKRLFISRNTVKKYIELFKQDGFSYQKLKELSDSELGVFLSSNEKKVSKKLQELQAMFPYCEKELKKVGVTKDLLWREYKKKHPEGYQSSSFCHYYNLWKQSSAVVMHFEHKAGDKLFIDYTGKKLFVTDRQTGEVQACEVFVAILGSSQYTYVEASRSQKKEDFVTSVENALHYFGGVPQAIVTDNLKSAVTKSSKYKPTLNDTFLDFARHYQTSIIPTRAYKPRDKSLVENAVRIAYTRIFAPLRDKVFFSIEELNQAILEKLVLHNSTNFQGRKYSRSDLFKEVEQKELYELPITKYEIKHYAYGTVYKNSHLYLNVDKHYYSVPYPFIGKKMKMIYDGSSVDIYYKHEPVASHKRNFKSFAYSTLEKHMPSSHQFVSDWNPDKFIHWAEDIGTNCKEYIIRILQKNQHPEQNYKSCIGILSFAKKVGKLRLNNACKRGLEYDVFNYRIIQSILEKGLDKLNEESAEERKVPLHQNIRGKNYYK